MSVAHLPDAVKVAVGIRRTIVVDDDVDTLDIDTTTEDVGSDQDTLLERLEGSVSRDTEDECNQALVIPRQRRNLPLLLHKAGMDRDTREVARYKELVKLDGTCNGLDEDDDLNRAWLWDEKPSDGHLELTWLKSSVSRSSFNFRFLPTSSIFT